MMNLFQILRDSADAKPDRPYLFGGTTEFVSYSEAVAQSAGLAKALRSCGGFSKEPVLAAVVEDAEQLVYLIWACLAAGICLAFLPKNRHPGQTELLMRQAGADALVSDAEELQALTQRNLYVRQSRRLRRRRTDPPFFFRPAGQQARPSG